jgi:type IV pilus assembly protein PilM
MTLPDFFGLDFGNHTVKVVQLKEQNKTPKLVAYGGTSTPFGVLKSENEEHQKQLADVTKELLKTLQIKTKNCVVALPESSIFTRLITLPEMKEQEIENAVFWEAKQYIPVDLEAVQLDWMEVGETKIGESVQKKILLVAAPKTLVELYIKVVKLAGLEPIALETEAVANVRAMSNSTSNSNAIILDFGAQSTDLVVMSKGNLLFSQTLSTGSDALTKAIMQDYSLTEEQAEQYKRTYGIDETQLEGKLVQTLVPVMNTIVDETRRAVSFYRTHSAEDAPDKVYLVGDGAKLPGLTIYMTKALGVESTIGNPWNNINLGDRFSQELASGSPGYSVAVGLSLKIS